MQITLRDLFAAAALAGRNITESSVLEDAVDDCWAIADMMLQARGVSDAEAAPIEPTREDIEAARTAIIAHYESGKFVQYQIDVPDGEWYDAQKGFLPIGAWHWNKYAYRIKPQ